MLFCDRSVFSSDAPDVADEFDELAEAVPVVGCVVVGCVVVLPVAEDELLAERALVAEPDEVADELVDPLLLPLLVPAAAPNPPPW